MFRPSQFAPSERGRHQVLFAIDFKRHKLTLIYCVELVTPVLLECLNTILEAEVECRESENVIKIRVSPKVFEHGSTEKVLLREEVMCIVFQQFLRRGWRPKFFTSLHRNSKRNCVIFELTGDCLKNPNVVALSTKSPKKLILQNGNSLLANTIKDIINATWSRGINYVSCNSPTACKFKFRGDPWDTGSHHVELLEGRVLILKIIKRFHKLGFSFLVSGHPGESNIATDTLYFLKLENDAEVTPLTKMCVLGLLGANKLYLLNHSYRIEDIVSKCIESTWKITDVSKSSIDRISSCLYKLADGPWTASGELGMTARYLLLRMFEELRINGWRLHCSLNLMHRIDDVSTFILTECKPQAVSYLSLSFHQSKLIRFVNARQEIVDEILKKLTRTLPGNFGDSLGLNYSYESYEGFPQIHLTWDVSMCIGGLLIILEKMEALGCRLVSAADLCARSYSSENERNPIGMDTWILEVKPSPADPDDCMGASGWTKT